MLKGDQENKIFIITGIIRWAIFKDKRLENHFKKKIKNFVWKLEFGKAGDLTNISNCLLGKWILRTVSWSINISCKMILFCTVFQNLSKQTIKFKIHKLDRKNKWPLKNNIN